MKNKVDFSPVVPTCPLLGTNTDDTTREEETLLWTANGSGRSREKSITENHIKNLQFLL